jgi:hypothetical protein
MYRNPLQHNANRARFYPLEGLRSAMLGVVRHHNRFSQEATMQPDQTLAPMPFIDDGPMWAADPDSAPVPAVPLPAGATEVGDSA